MIFDNLTPKEKGEAFYEAGYECAIDRVLAILDDSIRYWTTENKWSIPVEWVKTSYETDRERILKLKGGEQE